MTTRMLFLRLRYISAALLTRPAGFLEQRIRNDERGEGVISTAIVVLIIAFLAVGMWMAFKVIMGNATSSISTQVSQLGQ